MVYYWAVNYVKNTYSSDFLTGRDNEVDKILGLEIGADDYLTKPFNPRELTIRARNLLHRTMTLNGKETHLQRENYRLMGGR